MEATQRYVSKELTHFVGRNLREKITDENLRRDEQYKILFKIIEEKCIRHSIDLLQRIPDGLKYSTATCDFIRPGKFSDNDMFFPYMICFCDIPVEDLGIHISKYSHFGLSFKKSFLIERGASPLFYVEKNSAIENTTRSEYFDKMVDCYLNYCNYIINLKDPGKIEPKSEECFKISQFMLDLLRYIKFFDASKPDNDKDNFYMEREWRSPYYIHFEIAAICRIILPSSYSERFRNDVPEYIGQITFSDDFS